MFVFVSFANRIPLLFESGSDAVTRTAHALPWRSFKMNPKNDKIGVFVSFVSTKVPFSGPHKEHIGKDVKVVKEAVSRSLHHCCSQLKAKLSKRHVVKERKLCKKNLQQYVPHVASALHDVLKVAIESGWSSDHGFEVCLFVSSHLDLSNQQRQSWLSGSLEYSRRSSHGEHINCRLNTTCWRSQCTQLQNNRNDQHMKQLFFFFCDNLCQTSTNTELDATQRQGNDLRPLPFFPSPRKSWMSKSVVTGNSNSNLLLTVPVAILNDPQETST